MRVKVFEMDWDGASGGIEIMLTLKNSCLSDAAIRTYKHFIRCHDLYLILKAELKPGKPDPKRALDF